MNMFNNPYVHGNWQAVKTMKKSTGDNKHTPGSKYSPKTNTAKPVETVMDAIRGGVANPVEPVNATT
jgi:hypothetical protein